MPKNQTEIAILSSIKREFTAEREGKCLDLLCIEIVNLLFFSFKKLIYLLWVVETFHLIYWSF